MENMLFLQLVYLAVCLSIATIEVLLIVSYKTSKPAVFTTLSDMVSCDLSFVFLTTLYIAAATYLLSSAKIEINPILAFIIAPTATSLVFVIILYLLSKSLVEYFQLRLRVIDLANEYEQEDLLLFIRLTIAFVTMTFTLWIHVVSDVSPLYYFMTEADVTPEALLNIFLVITVSLIVSFVCLIIKFATRNEKRILLGDLKMEEPTKLPIWTYFFGILIMIIFLFSAVASFIINGSVAHCVFRQCIFGFVSTTLPTIIIFKDKKLRKFTFKHVKRKVLYIF